MAPQTQRNIVVNDFRTKMLRQLYAGKFRETHEEETPRKLKDQKVSGCHGMFGKQTVVRVPQLPVYIIGPSQSATIRLKSPYYIRGSLCASTFLDVHCLVRSPEEEGDAASLYEWRFHTPPSLVRVREDVSLCSPLFLYKCCSNYYLKFLSAQSYIVCAPSRYLTRAFEAGGFLFRRYDTGESCKASVGYTQVLRIPVWQDVKCHPHIMQTTLCKLPRGGMTFRIPAQNMSVRTGEVLLRGLFPSSRAAKKNACSSQPLLEHRLHP